MGYRLYCQQCQTVDWPAESGVLEVLGDLVDYAGRIEALVLAARAMSHAVLRIEAAAVEAAAFAFIADHYRHGLLLIQDDQGRLYRHYYTSPPVEHWDRAPAGQGLGPWETLR